VIAINCDVQFRLFDNTIKYELPSGGICEPDASHMGLNPGGGGRKFIL
jgi:hypothetical protein